MKWKRTIGWTLAGLVMLLLLAAIGGYIYLRSNSFEKFALQKIVEEANTATGGHTEISGLDFNLSTLTAHLYNITLRGTEGPDQPPLLQVDKLTVGLKIISVLRHEVSLRELLLEHPVVHLQMDRAGKNNLPATPPSQSNSHTSVFDLAVGHVQLTKGEIDYNDQKTPLETDLYDLQTDVHFLAFAKRYDGELSYKNGRLQYAQYAALAHNLSLRFSASPERFGLEQAILKIGSSTATLHASISNYSNPVADGDYQIRIHTQDLAEISSEIAPAGDLVFDGKLHYQSGREALLQTVSIDGRLASEALSAVASGSRVEVRRLQGTYQLSGGRLQVRNVSMETLGGGITANLDVKNLDGTPESRVQAVLHNISLRALQQTHWRDLKGASVYGRLDGTAEAAWKGRISNLRARSDLSVQAVASGTSSPAGSEVPVSGAIHATYDGPRQTIAVRQTSLRIPSATLTAQGEIGDHSSLQLQVAASDLHQLAALASSFRPSQGRTPVLSGSATLNATIQGSIKQPTIVGQLSAQNLQVEGSEWSSARLEMRATPSEFSVQNGSLVNAHRGRATFSASTELRDWSYQASNAIKASLNLQQMRISELLHLAEQHYPISGDLTVQLTLSGTQLDPVGSGTAQVTDARVYDEPIQNLSVRFHAADGSVVSTVNLAAPAGTVEAGLSYTPKTKAYKLRLDAPSLVLQKLHAVAARNLGVDGTLSASVEGEGTIDDPQLNAVAQLPQLQIREKNSISGLKAEAHVASHSADFSLDSKVSEASVHAHGHIALSGGYYTDATIDTGTVPLDVLLERYAKGAPQGLTGQTELHATLKGPLQDPSQVEAHLSIPILEASYQSLKIGIAGPIRADYSKSIVTLQPAEIRGTDTALRIQGRIPIGGTASANLVAQGSVDMSILRIFAPDVQSSGSVALDMSSSGSAAHPAVQGRVQLKDVALTTPDIPVGVEKLNGTLNITNDHLQVAKMTGLVGGGQVSIGGSIAYRPSLLFNLAVQGKSVRLRYPEGLRSLLDANLTFSGTTDRSSLNGRVLIDSLSFTSDFDLSKFADQFSSGTTIPPQPGFADNVSLAIAVQSPESLSATSSQASIAGRVALQVAGTAANPVITGRTTLTSGEVFYRNLRYQLQKGVITFDDPNETHPVINVSVTTTVEQYNLTLSLRGPLDKLTTSYVSDPPLATADVINLIARGKTTAESAASSQSTDAMIASQAVSELSGSVQKLVGISSLQIDPTIGGNSQNPSARVALQQRVTKNLLFSFSTDVSEPGSEVVQGEYQINKRWSVSVTRDQLGGVSVDGRYHTRF